MINIRKFLGLDYYVSPVDQFLATLEEKHPKASASQEVEIKKYRRIFKLRDEKSPTTSKKSFWDKF